MSPIRKPRAPPGFYCATDTLSLQLPRLCAAVFRYVVSPCSLFVGHYYDILIKKVLPYSAVLFFASFPPQKRSYSNSKWFVPMLGVLSRRIPRQVNKTLSEISQLDPCELFALHSRGRLRCTTTYYCTVSLRKKGTCAIVCPTTPSRVRVARFG